MKIELKWILTVVFVVALFFGCLYGFPTYQVWQQGMVGKAELERAEQNRQILIKEAQSKLEAAEYEGQAELKRAEYMRQAIDIESGALTPHYIHYLWVKQQDNLNSKTVVYIPTEAGLPILEAGRINNPNHGGN